MQAGPHGIKGLEFDADASYKHDVNSLEEMKLNFKLHTKVKADYINDNEVLFSDPAIKADFTEVVEDSINRVKSSLGRSIFRRLVPRNPVAYLPVGAAVVLTFPCKILAAGVNVDNEVEIDGRIDYNLPKWTANDGFKGMLDMLALPSRR